MAAGRGWALGSNAAQADFDRLSKYSPSAQVFAIWGGDYEKKLALLRRLAAERGLVVLTDSDAAGFMIRAKLKGAIDPALVKHAYIPDVPGRERRKRRASKEGKLGVEGMEREVLIDALRRAGATMGGEGSVRRGSVTRPTWPRWASPARRAAQSCGASCCGIWRCPSA